MEIRSNVSLKPYNTFHIDAKAKLFASFTSVDELSQLIADHAGETKFILGGGSNILFTKDFDGLVLKNEIRGIEDFSEDGNFFYTRVGGGENWHHFVMDCVSRGKAGVENLSLIPGNAGASPMQNIGAYGVELKDVFWELEAFHLQEKKVHKFSSADCGFGYRDSVFKTRYKDQYVILNVSFKLLKQPVFHTEYGDIKKELERMRLTELSIAAISQAVINIRSSKLPDPAVIGNAGSFFKNPYVSVEKYENLKIEFPAIVGYPDDDGLVKLAAGWMIEQCGWKGFRRGDAGCHERQALVLVNYGKAGGEEIFRLSEEILHSVKEKFGVELEREVNLI